jgi:hypothetical protein
VRARSLVIACLLLTLPEARAECDGICLDADAPTGQLYGLVIGINQFDDAAWPTLAGVPGEVDAVERALLAQGAVTVEHAGRNGRLTNAELRAAISHFLQTYGREADNRLVVYIASHGALLEREHQSFLVASNTPRTGSPGFAASAYSIDDLRETFHGVAARHVLLALNSCHSGGLLLRSAQRAESAGTEAWRQSLLRSQAWLMLTAGADDQTVPDADNPFARAFTEGLYGQADLDRDGLILGSELASYVRARVARETRAAGQANDPFFGQFDDPPDRKGDFVFENKNVAAKQDGPDLLQQQRAKLLAVGSVLDCPDCPEMVRVRAGVAAEPLAASRSEVTFSAWDACFRELACTQWKDDGGRGRGDRPVPNVSWVDALEFTRWLNSQPRAQCSHYRVPTPAEWEALAYGTATTAFPWGDALDGRRANCRGCGAPFDGPAPAGSFPALGGVVDAVGNLWEWVDTAGCDWRNATFPTLERCEVGRVVGGAWTTRLGPTSVRERPGKLVLADVVPAGARAPRFSRPTIGLRVVCTPGQ